MVAMEHVSPPLLTLFLPSLAAGGAERVLMAIAGELVRTGHRCDLVTAQAGGRWEARVPVGVRYIALGRRKPWHTLPRLVRYLRKNRPAAVLSSVFAANVTALAACCLTRTRCVIREAYWAREDAAGGSLLGRLTNHLALGLLYRRADAIVSLSEDLADHVHRLTGIQRERVVVISNPLIHAEDAPPPVSLPSTWGNAPLVLACGRLVPQKDYPTLLRAFSQLRKHMPAHLVILGEGPLKGELAALSDELGIGKQVLFAGYSANPHAWMRRADLFVSTSRWEGFPNVLLEALECGCPIASTRSSDAIDLILDHGRYGTIVPFGDNQAIAQAMMAALSRGGRTMPESKHLQRFSIEAVTKQYLVLLTKRRQTDKRTDRRAFSGT